MSAEQNKALVREYIEQVWNKHQPDMVEKYMSEDVVHHDAPGLTDRESIKNFIAATLNAFPDWKNNIKQEIAEGDLVVLRQTVGGTQQGALEAFGIPATGKQVSIVAVHIIRIANGKIAELWGLSDALTMMQQLGVIPAPQSG